MPATTETDPALPDAGPSPWRRTALRSLPWLVLLAGLLLTAHLWSSAKAEAINALREDFDFRSAEIAIRIETRMRAYEQILQDAAALLILRADITRADFHDYVQRLDVDNNFPGTQGIGYVPVLHPGEDGGFLLRARKEWGEGYALRSPPGNRPLTSPVLYLEPETAANLKVIGFDLLSEPIRHLSMMRAIESGETSISARVILIQDLNAPPQPGVLMTAPVYRRGMPVRTVEERRAAIQGLTAAPLRIRDLINGTLSPSARSLDDGVSLNIHDGDSESTETLLYSDATEALGQETAKAAPLFHASRSLTVGGRSWTLALTSRPVFDTRFSHEQLTAIAVAGIAASTLLALTLWLLIHGRDHAMSTALRMTAELREAVRQQEAMAQDLRTSETALADKATALEIHNRDLERFTEVLAHHLQEPVRKQHVFAQHLERQLPQPIRPELREALDFITDGALRLKALMRDVQLYLSVRQSQPELRPTSVDQAVETALSRLATLIKETGGEIERSPLPKVMADSRSLSNVFVSLIENSLRYRHPQRPPKLVIGSHRDGTDAVISVSDNGIGIDPQYRSRVFRVFERLDHAEAASGTGIGLSIARAIIESSHGSIWIDEPLDGIGTRVCLRLPLVLEQGASPET